MLYFNELPTVYMCLILPAYSNKTHVYIVAIQTWQWVVKIITVLNMMLNVYILF